MFSLQHFPEGKPTDKYPDPVLANPVGNKYTSARQPPKRNNGQILSHQHQERGGMFLQKQVQGISKFTIFIFIQSDIF